MDNLYTTLFEQCRELMAGKTLDFNLNLAYQLQMQEAMKASLALHNLAIASSSRTPPHPHPQPDDDDVIFIPQSLDDDALYITTTLMLEDMNRFMQELEDRKQSEAERKLKEDLDHWIHDQKLAPNIHNILDQQWEKYGDNYHRPYRTAMASSSSSKALVDSKCFRLYFKGLVSEKRVMGIVVNVASARVAICDSKDNLILEARKNVEAMVNKRVTFFCDDYMLYQYVSQ